MNKLTQLTVILYLLASSICAQISGTVFRDFNGNGTIDTNEPFLAGITVNAYNVAGSLCGTATSAGATAPNYTLTGCSGNIRVEFVLPNANNCIDANIDFSSTSGSIYGSSVQFVTATSTNVNFGINNPDDYNTGPLNTNIYIPTSTWGDPTGGGTSATFSWYSGYPYTYTGNNPLGSNPPTNVASGEIMGVTWGNAYSKHSQKLFTSALVKRHVGLGTLGTGGIYMLTPTGATFTVTPFYDLDANGYQTRANGTCGLAYGNGSSFTVDATGQQVTYNGTIDASGSPCGLGVVGTNSTERQLPINIGNFPSYDPAAFDQVGKVGIGDIDFSDDGRYLFVTNLYTQKILRLELNDAANPTGVVSVHIFDLPAIGCNNGILRPWGLDYHRGKLYIGAVCTGENGGSNNNTGAPTDLYAYVLKLDNPLGSGTVSNTPVVTVPLNYRKGDPFGSSQTNINEWYPWTNNTGDMVLNDNNAGLGTYPQPILSDIEFNDRGDLIIDFMDRAGHQFGIQNRKFLTNIATTLVSDVISGDILIAGYDCGTNSYSIENNGSVISQGTTYNGGIGNSEGIGGGEFFKGDKIPGSGHFETSQGSAAHLSGYNDMVFAVMDPIVTNSGGTVRMSMINGDTISASKYQLYFGSSIAAGYLGKANGLGDIELATPIAPLEIGNRVWIDTDSDGIQDAGEAAISGVTVQLVNSSGTVIATAVTSATGNYYFSNATGTNTTSAIYGITGLTQNTTYTVRIPNVSGGSKQAALGLNSLTTANAGGGTPGTQADVRDSDGSVVGVNAEASVLTTQIPVSGANNHTFDFGFAVAAPCTINSITATPGACVPLTNTYTLTGAVTFTDPPTTGTLTVQITGGGSQVFTAPFTSPLNYSIASQTADGASHTVTATFSADVACTRNINYSSPVSCLCYCYPNATCEGYAIYNALPTTVTNGPLTSSISTTIPCHGDVSVAYTLRGTGSAIKREAAAAFTPMNQPIYTGLGYVTPPAGLEALYLQTQGGQTQTLTYNFTPAIGAFDFIIYDIDEFDNIMLSATDVNGNPITDFTGWFVVSGDGTTATGTQPPGDVAPAPIWNPTTGSITSPTTLNHNRSFIVLRPTQLISSITINYTSTTTGNHIYFNVYGLLNSDVPGSNCGCATCSISSITATPGACVPATNTYTLTGAVTFTNPPTTGTLTVQITGGGSQVFTAPFTSPLNYSIASQTADGASHTVTATFSADVACTRNINYSSPVSCAPVCNIASAGLTAVSCNNNSTPVSGSDDYITFSLNPSGSLLGSSYTVSSNNGGILTPSSGTYGSATNFRLQNGSANSTTIYTITITDASGAPCTRTVTVGPVAPCSTCPNPNCATVMIIKN